jgi:3-methyladenine DNA glycosylase/8-oxoguanine DNA glycosylase
MFNLNRLDIFPKDDLGIQNGMKAIFNIAFTNKKELFSEMECLAENWRP